MKTKKISNFWLIFIIFLTSFLLGFLFCFKIVNYFEIDLLKKYYNISSESNKEGLDLSKFWLVYDIIKNNYFDADKINKEDLEEFAVSGLVKGLGDKYSEYFNLEANQIFTNSLSGDFEGIGAALNLHPLGVKVEKIINESPAGESDVRVGDVIISANGVSLKGLNIVEAASYIKGESGTIVVLEIIREEEVLTREVMRRKIKFPSIDYEEFEDNIGYISVNMFGDDTSKEFKEALYNLKDTRGIIIDLRDNGGGYLISAVEILSDLVKRGETLVITKYKDGKADEYYKSINNGNIYNGKIVILINENSASASEIVAGAAKELDIAIVVGKKSYGKGSVQKPFTLNDGSMVKLTISKWFTPKGVSIDEEGIAPNIEVSFIEEDYINLYDRQKEEAKKILNDFIESGDVDITIEKYLNEEIKE